MLKYVIKRIPPSNNDFIGRDDRWRYQKIKKEWAELIRYTCLPRPLAPLPRARVTLMYYFKDKRRRDPDNYSGKMILDGLTRAGIIADDSFSCIDLILSAGVDTINPRVEISIEEV